jgi:hypothetical protein
MKTTKNILVAANKAAKSEFQSLNQAVKAVAKTWSKEFAARYNLVKSDCTVKNVSEHWHSIKIDGKLAYRYYPKAGQPVQAVKIKFSTWDVLLSLKKMGESKVK